MIFQTSIKFVKIVHLFAFPREVRNVSFNTNNTRNKWYFSKIV